MKVEDQQLKSFLLDSDLITKKDLKKAEKAAKKQNQRLVKTLLAKKLISQEQLTRLYAYILGIPFINLKQETVKPETLQIIPEPIAREHHIVAYKRTPSTLEVAMTNPEDLETIEFIKRKTGLKIVPRLTSKESIENILRQYSKSLQSELKELTPSGIQIVKESTGQKAEDLEKIAQDLPIIKIVDTLLKHAILEEASDIHIEPLEKEVLVRYRIDGVLREEMTLPKQVLPGIVARIKVLSDLKLDEHRLPQDGRFKVATEQYKVSFRVSVLPTMEGEKIVMRLLPEESKGLTLESLGLRGEALEIVHQSIKEPTGMILVTGPTGSGKTTTLYTIIDVLNKPDINITTIEDPIEYPIQGVNQTQVKPKIGYDFANGLRAIVRQDPDIIMVGEIRDQETAGIAINSALTGHLLLSTLHTNDAPSTLPRLLEMGVEGYLAATTLNVVIAQRLARKVCSKCKKDDIILEAEQRERLSRHIDLEKVLNLLVKEKIIKGGDNWSNIKLSRANPEGCAQCNEGYKGRVGIFEVLAVDKKMQDLLTAQASTNKIRQTAKKNKMVSLAEDGLIKAVQGATTIEEVLRVTKQ